MYSTDRQAPLGHTISCLRDMDLYDQCQKTLIVDGKTNCVPKEFEIVQVPRVDGQFSWVNMWDAGVHSARFEKIVYLDSDRMLPESFLKLVKDVPDDTFMFTSKHFHMLDDLSIEDCKAFLVANKEQGVFMEDRFLGRFQYEPRFKEVVHGPGKNVMSGSVAFTKRTYNKIGGVDPWYRGHGAFADTDFHFTASQHGCEFIDLDIPEIHYHHKKLEGEEEIDEITLRRRGLDNFIYYCKKWGLPVALAEDLAVRCGILRPTKYVEEKMEKLQHSPRDFGK